MNGPGFNRALFAVALMLMLPVAALCGTPQVDIKKLSTEFDHWHRVNSADDFIYLDNTTWGELLFFWGPAPESMPKNIEEVFVLETVKSLRGELPDEFKKESGEKVKIHGHKGFTVKGTYGAEGINTLLTVFHCNKSDRLFLSQIDLHTECGTPMAVCEQLEEIERTISCHGVNRRINNPKVPLKMNFPALNLIFYIPDSWRSDVYNEGSTADQGAVWTLPMNSELKVYYATVPASGTDATAAAAATLDGFRSQLLKAGTGRTVELSPDGDGVPTDLGGRYLLKGSILVKDEAFAWDTGNHVFRMQVWDRDGSRHCLLYSILSRDEFEGRRVYLQPDESTFIELEERLSDSVDGFPAP